MVSMIDITKQLNMYKNIRSTGGLTDTLETDLTNFRLISSQSDFIFNPDP